jgi:hypothetical protein
MKIDVELSNQLSQFSEEEKLSINALLKGILERRAKNKVATDFILQYNREVEDALAAVESGEFVGHETVVKSL